ncbi:MAG: GntR family transcriptional regulator [Candidatus Promineifilaceae bacterium]|nr:GntR family transcriptional regulator [Anaerolineaceae bacterium]
MRLEHAPQRSLSEQAYELIRQRIVTLVLAPSAVVDEGRLQEELGLGRTPIREALKRLELERLVSIIPRRGIFVTPINLTDLQRLYEMRLTLECLATELAAQRGTAVHWQEMACVLDQANTTDNISPEQLIAIDDQCHRIIYRAADNQFLEQTLMALYPLSLRMWNVALAKLGDKKENVVKYQHIVEHEEIMVALKAGAAEEAVRLMRRHIEAYQQYIESVILGKSAQLHVA